MAKNRCDTCKHGNTDFDDMCQACSDGLDDAYEAKEEKTPRTMCPTCEYYVNGKCNLCSNVCQDNIRSLYKEREEKVKEVKEKGDCDTCYYNFPGRSCDGCWEQSKYEKDEISCFTCSYYHNAPSVPCNECLKFNKYKRNKKPEIRITDDESRKFWEHVYRVANEPTTEQLREMYNKGLLSGTITAKSKGLDLEEEKAKIKQEESWKTCRKPGESDEDFRKRLKATSSEFNKLCNKIKKKYKKD